MLSLLLGGNCLSIRSRKLRAILVFTVLLKGGLYQITLRLRCLFLLVIVLLEEECSYFKVASKLLCFNALL